MIKRLVSDAKILLADKIFKVKGEGESCCHCGEMMMPKHAVTTVGNGDKMHDKCWPGYITAKIDSLSK